MTGLNEQFAIPPHVMARQVGEETVLLDLESGTYFGLDDVGARIWQLLEGGKSVAETCALLLAEYDVEASVLEHDALALVQKLVDAKLLEKQ